MHSGGRARESRGFEVVSLVLNAALFPAIQCNKVLFPTACSLWSCFSSQLCTGREGEAGASRGQGRGLRQAQGT